MDEHQSSAPAQPVAYEKYDDVNDVIEAHYACLERLEERYRHELMDHEERQELEDRIIALRRRLRL